MTPRLLLVGIGGLDWALMQARVDAGHLPNLAKLLTRGSSGRLAVPSGHATAVWTSFATGVAADRHGLVHDRLPAADGLRLLPPGREHLQVPALWDRADAAGLCCHVAGWPALLPAHFMGESAPPEWRGGARVTAGFESISQPLGDCWPMPPGQCWPPTVRELVRDCQLLPTEAPADAVDALLAELPPSARQHPTLRAGAASVFSRWAGVQALALHWLATSTAGVSSPTSHPAPDLIALRFSGLLGWGRLLAQGAGRRLPDALGPTYAWLDLLLGHALDALAPSATVALVTDQGLPLGGYRGSGNLLDAPAPGGLILAGPGIPADQLLPGDATAYDLAPTLMACLNLPSDDSLDGRNLLAPHAMPLGRAARASSVPAPRWPAPAPLHPDLQAWLDQHGLTVPDHEAWLEPVRRANTEARLAWALARRARGELSEAVQELRQLVGDSPSQEASHIPAWLALGETLLLQGQADACAEWLTQVPPALREGVWGDAIAGLVAHARADWAEVQNRLQRVVDQGPLPFNAPAWLGWARLHQQDWAGALALLETGLHWPGERRRLWLGLGLAHFHLGHFPAAAHALGQAVAEAPQNARLHALRALAWSEAGQHEAARAGWQRALALEPGLPSAAAALMASLPAGDALVLPARVQTPPLAAET